MKKWAGYNVNFVNFKKYYRATSRTDNSRYLDRFATSFSYWMDQLGYPQGLYSDTVNWVDKNMSKLCTKVRTSLVSKGVPPAAVTQITNSFKRWFKNTYDN